MKTICLYFEIHQIIHLKRYRCFDIGTDHYYYDDYENERSITEIAERSYIPALTTLLEMVKNNGGAFKVAFSISGVALEQLEIYSPAVIDLLHQLNDTGCCEFLCECKKSLAFCIHCNSIWKTLVSDMKCLMQLIQICIILYCHAYKI